MKSTCSFNSVIAKITILLLFINEFANPQINYIMKIENCSKINNTTIEFEVSILSTEDPFLLTSYQCVFTFNDEIINGGNLSFHYLSNSSQLSNQPSYGIGINNSDNQIELTFASLAGNDTISVSSRKIGRFRLSNSESFSGNGFSIYWNFSGNINTIITGENFINITNPFNHLNFSTQWDTIPPALDSIAIVDSTSLVLYFSETLDSSNISSPLNYQFTGGINFISACLINPGNAISIYTTAHILGEHYSISVQNIKDLYGNLISSNANSLTYSYGNLLNLDLKVFLEGPFTSGVMKTFLNEMNLLPLEQPFGIPPWNYNGNESVSEFNNDVVDWILVELRKDLNDSTTIARKAGLLLSDGSVREINNGNIIFRVLPDSYYVVIKHRNHLGIMSAHKINSVDNNVFYDFTTSLESAYGSNSLANLGDGYYGMFSGDADGNCVVNLEDLTGYWRNQNGYVGYKSADFDLNGGVNISDKNSCWLINQGKSSSLLPN